MVWWRREGTKTRRKKKSHLREKTGNDWGRGGRRGSWTNTTQGKENHWNWNESFSASKQVELNPYDREHHLFLEKEKRNLASRDEQDEAERVKRKGGTNNKQRGSYYKHKHFTKTKNFMELKTQKVFWFNDYESGEGRFKPVSWDIQ